MELARFAYQVYISISHLNCAWLALMVSLVRIIEVRPNISITGHSRAFMAVHISHEVLQ